jgi:glutathione S-transferase
MTFPTQALRIGTELGESSVVMEYLEERFSDPGMPSLLPPLTQPYQRARARLAADFVNRNIIPCFYRYLLNQEEEKQAEYAREFLDYLIQFVEEFDKEGPFWGGKELGWVDVMVAPWILRAKNVLTSV